jgi:hypothetical protein
MTKVWTEAEIRALGIRTDGVTACSVVLGVGPTVAYRLLKTGDVPFKLIKVPTGRNRYVVPGSELIRLLGLNGAPTEKGD